MTPNCITQVNYEMRWEEDGGVERHRGRGGCTVEGATIAEDCRRGSRVRAETILQKWLHQIRLESRPKMNLLDQSKTTNTLVRQLTCLLNVKQVSDSDKLPPQQKKILECGVRCDTVDIRENDTYLAYTEYQSHCVLRPIETQSPGSSAAACSPPNGANCPRCLYLVFHKMRC